MYLIVFSSRAGKDRKLLKAAGLEEKTKKILSEMMYDPFYSPPPAEKLIGQLRGNYSRRINILHRIIFSVEKNSRGLKDGDGIEYEGIVIVKRMWTHYE